MESRSRILLCLLVFAVAGAAWAAGTEPADLAVAKTAPATAAAGTNLTYTITVTNGGPGAAVSDGAVSAAAIHPTAFGVYLNDVLPAQTTFVSLAQTSGPTFACTTPAAGANGTVSCNVAALATTDVATFSLVVAILPGATGTVSNTATILTLNTTDPNPANDSAIANTQLTSGAAVPAMSPLALALLAAGFALTGFVVLRRSA